MKREIQPGCRVQYSAKWLRSTGTHVGPICFVIGTVQTIRDYGSGCRIATVAWDDDPSQPLDVAVANLVTVAEKHLECVD